MRHAICFYSRYSGCKSGIVIVSDDTLTNLHDEYANNLDISIEVVSSIPKEHSNEQVLFALNSVRLNECYEPDEKDYIK